MVSEPNTSQDAPTARHTPTPGPWRWFFSGNTGGYVLIAGDKNWPTVVETGGPPRDELTPDQHLIQAAPDLLDVLEALYEMWGERRDKDGDRHCLECDAVGDPDGTPMPHESDCAFLPARAAIQKARGDK